MGQIRALYPPEPPPSLLPRVAGSNDAFYKGP